MAEHPAPQPPARAGFEFTTDLGGDLMIDTQVIPGFDQEHGSDLHLTLTVTADPVVASADHARLAGQISRRAVPPLLVDSASLALDADPGQVRAILSLSRENLDALIGHLTAARERWAS